MYVGTNCLSLRRINSGFAIAIFAVVLAGCGGSVRDEAPVVTYIPDSGYYLMMAEIALERKEYLVAAEEYLNAAQLSDDIDVARRTTEFAMNYGYETFALAATRRWLVLAPEARRSNEYAARLYQRQNNLEQSLYHWRKSLDPDLVDSDDAYLDLGTDILAEGDPGTATRLISRLVVENPDSPGLQFALAQGALQSGNPALAIDSAEKAARGNPGWLAPPLLKAQALMAAGDDTASLQAMQQLILQSPTLPIAMEYIRLLSAAGRTREADEGLRRLINEYGGRPDMLRLQALMALSNDDPEAAEDYFRELLAAGSNVYESYYYLGRIELARGNYLAAIDHFDRILSGNYILPAQLTTARAYQSLDDPQAGLDHLDRFIVDHPHYLFDILTTQAQLLQSLGRTDEALERFEFGLRFMPYDLGFLIGRGTLLDLSGRYDEAIESMRQAVEVAPMDSDALNTLGYTMANRTARFDEAYRYIRLALELDPNSPAVVDSMGWVLYRLGRYEESISYLEQAYAEFNDPEVVAHLGEVLWVSDQQERAAELWDGAWEVYPDSEPLAEVRERFLQ
jgi:tetratricopeptide (TPR) repeat protein